jgi:S-adenosyl methyltransferase
VSRPRTAPDDLPAPDPARIFNYMSGGKDNYAADREAGDEIDRMFPGMKGLVRQHRQFARAAAKWLAAQGVTQFIDVCCGLVPPVIGEVVPDARVAYVDPDPVVLSHARALLAGERAAAVGGDVSRPDLVLADPGLLEVIDLAEPAAVLLCGPLSAMGADAARETARGYAAQLAPGSSVAICGTSFADQEAGDKAAASYEALTGDVWFSHPEEVIESFFGSMHLAPPGVADVRAWWGPAPTCGRPVCVLGAIGIKP